MTVQTPNYRHTLCSPKGLNTGDHLLWTPRRFRGQIIALRSPVGCEVSKKLPPSNSVPPLASPNESQQRVPAMSPSNASPTSPPTRPSNESQQHVSATRPSKASPKASPNASQQGVLQRVSATRLSNASPNASQQGVPQRFPPRSSLVVVPTLIKDSSVPSALLLLVTSSPLGRIAPPPRGAPPPVTHSGSVASSGATPAASETRRSWGNDSGLDEEGSVSSGVELSWRSRAQQLEESGSAAGGVGLSSWKSRAQQLEESGSAAGGVGLSSWRSRAQQLKESGSRRTRSGSRKAEITETYSVPAREPSTFQGLRYRRHQLRLRLSD
ncbi:hypothetical protein EYF80_032467 [Liparis tanakae]|uniref:Uncharacterized protein n=1 Tax=Liparis tanakae TaxID=230148 RepID=A0A4Z2GUK1_9TELE|nr:hypothetical protein EYF80_032467 [Liparis tanakae]